MDLRLKSFEEYKSAYKSSVENPDAFWDGIAKQFKWIKPYDKVCEWDFRKPDVKWFVGGKVNITENALDVHLQERPDQTAILWEPNEVNEPALEISYKELYHKVCRFANALKKQGIQKGDRVVLYMPMVPELAIACLACARIGAIHSVVFAGFSAKAMADRINDASAKMVITADELRRGDKRLNIKEIVDTALEECASVERVIVYQSKGEKHNWHEGRDLSWDEAEEGCSDDCAAEPMDSEDMLFILYTSGSTGKPKGVVHTHGGYMVYATYSFQNVFQYEPGDIYWCTADIGWITGHSYIVYGPLISGATTMMFEGIPSYPDPGRFWKVCEKHKVNQFYTAPTAIRALMGCGNEFVEGYDLSSLKVLGTVGEPINEEAWEWYHKMVGKENCPIVDTWWQTETGGIMISGLGDHSPQKPTFAGYPLPGIQPVIKNDKGETIEENGFEGLLCIQHPWPSVIRTTYGNHERCKQVYFSAFDNCYFTGDGAKRDENGMYRIIGRVDDVINVSGHRFGTAEIEDAINQHPEVIESAVVGFPHEVKGQGIYAFVIGSSNIHEEGLEKAVRAIVEEMIGKIARPDHIQIVDGLPKTRSGKIMRRILRKIVANEADQLGDTSTLLDPEVVDKLIDGVKT
ncbi:MAG: acetate--CoA ligase [Flavobacteriales bacterium]|nr:acetate--CoA ligase [Flavobacteriales bacterium]